MMNDPDQLRELEMLRSEYRAAISAAHDPEERYRLYRMVQELNACIERIQQKQDPGAP